MFAATTKGSFLLENIADTCDVLERAVNLAFEGRPGPVHIHVPENLTHAGQSVDNYRDIRLDVRPVLPDPARVSEAASVLAEAIRAGKRILLLAGSGAVRSGAHGAVRALVERFQIPLATTMDGKGIIPERHPLCVGVFSDSGHNSAWKAFREADLVLAVGNSFAQHATFNFRQGLLDGKTLIHVNISADEIGKSYKAAHAIVSDAKPAVEALLEALSGQVGPQPPREVERQDHEDDHILHLPGPIHPGQLSQAISRHLPENGMLLSDAGAHAAWLAYYVQLKDGQYFRKPGGFGPMAGHINGALGLKMAYPDRPVVVGCGDGGYLLSGFELLTAVQYNIPIVWVIFNDGEFKLIKIFQLATFHEAGLVEFGNPDYVAYAKACGAQGYRVESLAEFEDAFAAALASGRPTVIDAAITRFALPHYSSTPDGVIAGLIERFTHPQG